MLLDSAFAIRLFSLSAVIVLIIISIVMIIKAIIKRPVKKSFLALTALCLSICILTAYAVLFKGNVQNNPMDITVIADDFDNVKKALINNGESALNGNYYYKYENSDTRPVIEFYITFCPDTNNEIDREAAYYSGKVQKTGKENNVEYTFSTLYATKEATYLDTFTGGYGGWFELNKNNEKIICDFCICKDIKWYDRIITPQAPELSYKNIIDVLCSADKSAET